MVERRENLSGKRFGTLQVTTQSKTEKGKTFWWCVCDCGNAEWCRADRMKGEESPNCSKKRNHSSVKIDITNQRFGRLVATGNHLRVGRFWKWQCKCDCGGEIFVCSSNLRNGHTRSCGCLQRERASAQGKVIGPKNRTHGAVRTPEWLTWKNMRTRCYSQTAKAYRWYGAKGVKVYDDWKDSFENFLAYLVATIGRRPPKHQLDRIDPQGNYEPGNIRWASAKEQQRNRRKHRLVTWRGETYCVGEWAERTGIPNSALWSRLFKVKWDVEKAMTTPYRKKGRAEDQSNSESEIVGEPDDGR